MLRLIISLIGKEATKTKIVQQMPQANLINLATHGLLGDIRQLGYLEAIALNITHFRSKFFER
jgi:hypothetical protein